MNEAKRRRDREKELAKLAAKCPGAKPQWKISEPMGGRMLDIDPILTNDERHLILAYNTSVQVFSAAESLLVRKIPLPIHTDMQVHEVIVSICLSRTSPNNLWVASSRGRIWSIDWTTGVGSQKAISIKYCQKLSGLAVERIKFRDGFRDILFVSLQAEEDWSILALDFQKMDLKAAKVIVTRPEARSMRNLRSTKNGQALAASSHKDIILGILRSTKHSSLEDLTYEIVVLDCSDEITCLDIRGTERVHLSQRSQQEAGNLKVMDIAVGCARGAVFFYNDILPQLKWLEENKTRNFTLQPRKYHWHRKAVHAVKWSRDGNYIISGGSESVLVLWQLDTGRIDTLPHLTATIENIVISNRGSYYVVHLDDNSTMVLSTAEMKPTTYISGIQTMVLPPPVSKDDLIFRVSQLKGRERIVSRIPAAINPRDVTRLQLCVGNGQSNRFQALAPMPLLQTLDLSTVQGISKQSLARTHPTDVNTNSEGYPIIEPRIVQLAYSQDGRWLATVDEWEPPSRDIEALDGSPSERREVYLKFWSSAADGQSFELLCRINAPHYNGHSEAVLDLAADPSSHRFATIGEDGIVRLWQPAVRHRDGLVVQTRTGRQLETWACSRVICLQENKSLVDSSPSTLRSGAVSFSEDGSMLACAFQNGTESAVYIVDAESGQILVTLDDLIRGKVQGLQVLSSQLIVLSNDLVVYNVVLDEMTYGITLFPEGMSLKKLRLSHLAVDYPSQSFAVAVSRTGEDDTKYSELAVFTLDQCEPDLIETIPHPVVSLVTLPGSSSFIVLDSAAQLWSISRATDMKAVTLAQPLADIHLDEEPLEPQDTKPAVEIIDGAEQEPSDDEMDVDLIEDEVDDDDDTHQVIVPQQKVAELFDAAPPFAMPPVEDMFYQVARLFSSKASISETV